MNSYASRRAALIAQMQARGGGVAIIPTAPEVMRNRDADYPYRHDSYFYYLSGFTEPEAVLVLVASAGTAGRSILFCRDKDPEREIWDGYRHGPQAAREQFGFDALFRSSRWPPKCRNCWPTRRHCFTRSAAMLAWTARCKHGCAQCGCKPAPASPHPRY